jgi:hypothetical protein
LPDATADAARLIHDRLKRAGIPVDWHRSDPTRPLLIAGQGGILIVTYLDDADPAVLAHQGRLPSVSPEAIRAPGIRRKASVIAALGTLLAAPELADTITVVVESDRHQGSPVLEDWLDFRQLTFAAAFWEAVDLPVHAPAIYQGGNGQAIIQITTPGPAHAIEDYYAGVVDDAGFRLLALLGELQSIEREILIDGFYRGVFAPDEISFDTVRQYGQGIGGWLTQVTAQAHPIAANHIASGLFFAPSISIREIAVRDNQPYLGNSASATITLNLVPGQSIPEIVESLTTRVRHQDSGATVEVVSARASSTGGFDIDWLRNLFTPVFSTAPGPNPASVLAEHAIPALGFSLLDVEPGLDSAVSMRAIEQGTSLLQGLVNIAAETAGSA